MYFTRDRSVTVVLIISLLVIIYPIIMNYKPWDVNTMSELQHYSHGSDEKRNKESFSAMKNLSKAPLPIMKKLSRNYLPVMKNLGNDFLSMLDKLKPGPPTSTLSTSSVTPASMDTDSVSRTPADPDSGSTDCVGVHLSHTKLPLTYLASFPGSGNTWVRHLLQQASGKLSRHL